MTANINTAVSTCLDDYKGKTIEETYENLDRAMGEVAMAKISGDVGAITKRKLDKVYMALHSMTMAIEAQLDANDPEPPSELLLFGRRYVLA